jgi:hypothetical protein
VAGRPLENAEDALSTQLTVDTNFFEAFSNWPSEREKHSLLSCRDRGSIEVFLSLESLEESTALYVDEPKLRTRAEVILAFLRDRLLARPEDIVDSELRGHTQLLECSRSLEAVRAVFQQVVGGQVPSSIPKIAARATGMKRRTVAYYRTTQDQLRSLPKQTLRELARKSYPEFHRAYWDKHGMTYLTRFASARGIEAPEEVARHALDAPAQFPFTTTLMTVVSRLLHRYLVLNRRIDEGDAYDVRQLIYMPGLDALVTDDRKVHQMFGELYGTSKHVYTVPELLSS